MADIVIRPGQKWRDKDRRREIDGSVRTFVVVKVGEVIVVCNRIKPFDHWQTNVMLRRSRFGSGRANDSFELVEDVAE